MDGTDDDRAGAPTVPGKDTDAPDQTYFELDPSEMDPAEDPSVSVDELDIDTARLFKQTTEQTRMALCISDPRQDDMPIVFVNQAFVDLTGYARDEIVGRNCRFLQGPDTDPADVERVREAIRTEAVRVVELLNYRKDGTPFWNALHIGPVYDDAGRLTHFYGSQWDITELRTEREAASLGREVAEELRHRTRNLFGVVTAIVRLSADGAGGVGGVVEAATRRIEALARAHEASIASGEAAATDLRALVEAILAPYRSGTGTRVALSGPAHELSAEHVTPLGLCLHELATNALKYGGLSAPGGTLRVAWEAEEDGRLALRWSETVPGGAEAGMEGTGSRLLRSVLGVVGGSIETAWDADGMRATLRL